MFDINLYSIPGVIIALTVHEYAHARVADNLGDPTPKRSGRLTLNPLAHIDIFGFLMLLFVNFGWAKPVPFNPNYFKNPKKGELYVALAGPVINLFCAFFIVTSMILLQKYGILNNSASSLNIIVNIIQINVVFAVFNMLPLAPLDGSRIFCNILPDKFAHYIMKTEPYSTLILIMLILCNNHIPILTLLISPFFIVLNKFQELLIAIL